MIRDTLVFFAGEKCDVRLEVFLETNLDKLYDILVLHLDGGKDMFITVSADCQQTSFTTAISTLVRIPVPIMHAHPEQFKNAVSLLFLSFRISFSMH